MTNYYAGIGSRETPDIILLAMTEIANDLANLGYVLRSGGAKGADRAFELGALDASRDSDISPIQIFHPANATAEAIEMAGKYHPNWNACKPYVRLLHARNCQIVLGWHVKADPKPVKFIICWTPDGKITGGTGQALRMAKDLEIPVINLAIVPTIGRVMRTVESIMA